MTTVALLGIAAAILSLIDPVPYVRDILRGTTRPHRGTWLIWSALWSETLSTYVLAGTSGVLSVGAVGAIDVNLLLYPAYFAVVNGAIAGVIAYRRRTASVVQVQVV